MAITLFSIPMFSGCVFHINMLSKTFRSSLCKHGGPNCNIE